MQDTIEGECETAYTVQSVSYEDDSSEENNSGEKSGKKSGSKGSSEDDINNVLNVTKSINFEKCQRRPDIRYNYRFQDWCPSCEQRYSAQVSIVVKYD